MAQKKITVTLGAEFNQADLVKIADDLRKAVTSGTSTETMKNSAQRYAASLIAAANEIEKIRKKGSVDATDIKNLQRYTATIESNLVKLQETAGKVSAAPVKLMTELQGKLDKVKKDSEAAAKKIEQEMTGALSAKGFRILDFKTAEKEINIITSRIQTMQNDLATKAAQDPNFLTSKEGTSQAQDLKDEQERLKVLVQIRDQYNKKLKDSNTTFNKMAGGMKGAAEKQQKLEDQKFLDYLKSLGISVDKVTQEFLEFKQGTAAANVELNNQTQKQAVMGDVLTKVGDRIKNTVSLLYLFRQAWRVLGKGIASIKELDKEMTNIGIVTKQTNEDMWKTFNQFNKLALDLSTTTKQYLEGARIFYQQGYKTAEVIAMVDATTKAAALSSVSFAEASETLTAAINAYNMEATEAAAVTDKYAAVGAYSAADFHELSVAMEKVASSAYTAGMSFDATLGILAKGIETTREAPEAIGTALKTIIARFQEMKEDPMAVLEDGVNANRVEKALKTIGVQLRDTSGEFRDLGDVFNDLGGKWSGLTRNQKAYIATMAAGARQQSRFMAIMNDYDRTLELINMSTNSAGEANQQYAIYTDSVEAAQNRFNNSLEAFYSKLTSSEAIKVFYKAVAGLVDVFTSLGPLLTGIIALITVLGIRLAFSTIAINANTLAQTLNNVATDKAAKGVFGWIAATIKKIFFLKLETTATITATEAAVAFNVATGAVLLVVGLLIAGITYLAMSYKSAGVAAAEAADKQKAISDQAKLEAKNLDSLIDRYKILNSKIDLTTSEREELASIKREIMDIAPQLIDSIDSEGNIRLKNIATLEKELSIKKQIAMFEARKTLDTASESAKKNTWESQLNEEEKKQMESAQSYADELLDVGFGTIAIANTTGQPTDFWAYQEQINGIIKQIKDGTIDLQKAKDDMFKVFDFSGAIANVKQNYSLETTGDNAAMLFSDAVSKITSLTGKYNKDLNNKIYNELYLSTDNVSIEKAVNEYITALTGGESSNIEGMVEKQKTQILNLIDGAVGGMSLFAIEKYNSEKLKVQNALNDYTQGLFEWKKSTNPGTEYNEVILNTISGLSDTAMKMLERSAKEISTVTGFANADLDKNNITTAEEIMDYVAENARSKADALFEELMKYGIKLPDTVKAAQDKIADLIKKGATQGEIQSARESLQGILETQFAGASQDIKDLVFKSNALDSAYEERTKQIAKLFYSDFTEETGSAQLEQAKGFYNKFTSKMGDFISGLVDTGDAGLIGAAKTILSTATEEQAKALNEAFANVDPTSPASIENFKALLKDTFGSRLTEEQISNMFVNTDVYLELFLKKTTEIFKQIKTLQSDLKSSLSGTIGLENIDELTKTYGEGAIQANGTGYSIDTEALVAQQREYNNQLLTTQFDTIAQINLEMEELAGKEGALTREDTARLAALTRQKELTEKIVADIEHIDLMEGAILNHQSVLDGVSALNSLSSSLKGLASVYEQVKEGGMTLFQTLDAIAENPALIGALEKQNGVMRLGTQAIKAMADQKKKETLVFLNTELAKVEAAISAVDSMISAEDAKAAVIEENSKEAITQMGSETSAKVEATNTDITAEEGGITAVQASMDADAERTEQFLINAQARLDALKTIASAEGKTISGSIDISGFTRGTVNAEVEKLSNEDYATILANRYGIPIGTGGATDKQVLAEIRKRLLDEKSDLQTIITEVTKLTTDQMLSQIASGGSKKEKGGGDKFEAFMGEFDRYYNYLKKIEKLQSDLSALDAQIGLEATGGAKDVELIRKKGKALAEQNAVLTKLIDKRKEELKINQQIGNARYGGFISFVNDEIQVRWDLIQSLKISNEAEEEWYQGMLDFIDSYSESTDAIEENTEALTENAAALEEIYNGLIESAGDVREELYKALVEADQREIDETKEKFDKMKEIEDDYLEAVKKAIDEERQAREDANKEEDLTAKKRKLAILQRDTSGLFSQEAAKLQSEINKDEQALRDNAIDRQYETLQNQYKLQQEQRDLEIQSLEEQMATREENGYYWLQVDDAIRRGPQSMLDILTNTQEFLNMDPLLQPGAIEKWNNSIDTINKLYQDGLKVTDTSVVNAIQEAIKAIISQQSSTNIDTGISGPNAAGSLSSGGIDITKVGTSSDGIAVDEIKALQTWLNNFAGSAGFTKLTVDGSYGTKSKAAMRAVALYASRRATTYKPAIDSMIAKNLTTPAGIIGIGETLGKLPPVLRKTYAFKKGGLADFTGPAWVDGTPDKPEAFLDSYQTKIFAHLRDILENKSAIDTIGGTQINNPVTIGDINITLENPTNANPAEIAKMVRKVILDTYQNRLTMSVQKSR